MPPPDPPAPDAVVAAVSAALAEARWQSRELVSRRPPKAAADLLRGQAGEMAFSPIARDQILGLALSAAAAELERGSRLVTELDVLDGPAPSEALRQLVRAEAYRSGPLPASQSRKVAETLERRRRLEGGSERDLAERLREEAALHTRLWDDPRLPSDSLGRLVMLCAVPKLLERAEALEAASADAAARDRRGPLRRLVRRVLSAIPTGWLVGGGVVAFAIALGASS